MRSLKFCADAAPVTRALAVAMMVLLSGCATMQPPKPWEKAQLAKPEMQFDADPIDARLADHIYTSKEAGSGGYGVGGGGCGCN
ncbi:MAG TPA: DUF4266 domain-containing protein [Casimicrobiaceae bacterium]|jgi:hypothetical protein|nr:DUF4266 domain-containing protein [Casimicrobiaceae bacterium]